MQDSFERKHNYYHLLKLKTKQIYIICQPLESKSGKFMLSWRPVWSAGRWPKKLVSFLGLKKKTGNVKGVDLEVNHICLIC